MTGEEMAFLMVGGALLFPLLIIGITLCCGKGADLIAGYNTASPKEKDEYDEKALCRATGVLVLLVVADIVLIWTGMVLEIPWLEWGGGMVLLLIAIVGVNMIGRNSRFRKKK